MARALLFYCWSLFDWRVFRRMRSGLAAEGLSMIVVTNLLSVWLQAKLAGVPCRLVRSRFREPTAFEPDVENCLEVRRGLIKAAPAGNFQRAVWHILERVFRQFEICGLVMWNGTALHCHPLRVFARSHGLPTLYCELANIDGYMFADPDGTNGAARIGTHPEMLDGYAVRDEEIEAWRAQYLAERMSGYVPPQGLHRGKINFWFPLDWLGYVLFSVSRPDRTSPVRKLIGKFQARSVRLPAAIPPPPRYVFLPLQVSADSNLLLYSDVDNLQALELAGKRADALGCQLVVKPHPAETDHVLLGKIAETCSQRGYLLTSFSTTALVLGAEEVVTINSTVGMEALLLDKPLTVLGRSLYARFTSRQAFVFALKHLVRIELLGREAASPQVVAHFLRLMGLSTTPRS